MSGRGNRQGRGRGRGGRGSRRGRGGRGNYGSGSTSKSKGMCGALGNHVFDYGPKAADQMRVTLEKITQHVGTIFGHEISTELGTKTRVTIPQPEYTMPSE